MLVHMQGRFASSAFQVKEVYLRQRYLFLTMVYKICVFGVDAYIYLMGMEK